MKITYTNSNSLLDPNKPFGGGDVNVFGANVRVPYTHADITRSVFGYIAQFDKNMCDFSEKDIENVRKELRSNSGSAAALRSMGIESVRYDAEAGIASIIMKDGGKFRIEFKKGKKTNQMFDYSSSLPVANQKNKNYKPVNNLRVSNELVDHIKSDEKFESNAYICPAGKPTIGYGHTKNVKMGQTVNKAQGEKLLREDLSEAESGIKKLVKVSLTQPMYDALVSFVFNVGYKNFEDSTLLKLLNKGDYTRAAAEFTKWVHGGGQVLDGLVKRRNWEKTMFLR